MKVTVTLSGCKKIVLDENDDELNITAEKDKNYATVNGTEITFSFKSEKKITLEEVEKTVVDKECNTDPKSALTKKTVSFPDIRSATGDASDVLELNIKMLTGKNFTIQANNKPTDTVCKLKHLIRDKGGLSPDQQRLIHKGKQLEDHRSLLDYKIKNGDSIILDIRSAILELYVKTITGKTITVHAYPLDTVAKMKQLIQDKEGIPPYQQRLIYGGKGLAVDNTLDNYGIRNGSTIHLLP